MSTLGPPQVSGLVKAVGNFPSFFFYPQEMVPASPIDLINASGPSQVFTPRS